MKKYLKGIAILPLAALVGCATTNDIDGDAALLAAESDRITDQVIAADQTTIQGLRDRLQALNEGGVDNTNYFLTKARNWVDFAYDEYTDNDRSVVAEAALQEALALIESMEAGQKQISTDTKIIETSTRLREDLWAIANRLKQDPVGFQCAQANVAELEVQLVWAGHEYEELGWRHAVPAIDKAERLARSAEESAANCGQPQLIAGDPCKACDDEVREEIAKIPALVYFERDSARVNKISRATIDKLVVVLNKYQNITLRLEAYTDQRMSVEYNRRLSKRRAKAVAEYLVSKGVKPTRIQTVAMGEKQLASEGCQPLDHAKNRRVEFVVLNSRGVEIQRESNSKLFVDPTQPADCGGAS